MGFRASSRRICSESTNNRLCFVRVRDGQHNLWAHSAWRLSSVIFLSFVRESTRYYRWLLLREESTLLSRQGHSSSLSQQGVCACVSVRVPPFLSWSAPGLLAFDCCCESCGTGEERLVHCRLWNNRRDTHDLTAGVRARGVHHLQQSVATWPCPRGLSVSHTNPRR